MATKKPSAKKAATPKPKKAANKPQSKAKPVKKAGATKVTAKSKPSSKAKPAAKHAAKPTAKPAAKPAAKHNPKAATKASPKVKPAKATDPAAKQPAGKGKAKPKASDYIKRPSHTPAIFKPPSKRATHIVLSMDEVRELLRKRSKEDRKESGHDNVKSNGVAHDTAGKAAHGKGSNHRVSKHHAASLADILGINASKHGGHGNVPRKHQKYYKLLVELRDHVREELNLHSSDTLKRSQKEDAGDLSISVDAGTDNFDRDFALSLLSTEQESLKEIEAAIQRIHDGTYGICEVTGKPIDAERLEAVPFTRFSLEGQREYENNQRRRITRTGAFINEASAETISFGDDDGEN